MRKMLGFKEKQCLQWAQVRKILLSVKVGYYPLMPLACTSVYAYALAMVVYCLLTFIVDNLILFNIKGTNAQSYGLW